MLCLFVCSINSEGITTYIADDFTESIKNCFSSKSPEALLFRVLNIAPFMFLANELGPGRSQKDLAIAGTVFFLGMCYIDFYKNKFFGEKDLFFKKVFYTAVYLASRTLGPDIVTFAELKALHASKPFTLNGLP